MSLYEGAKTRVRVHFKLSRQFEVNEGMHRGSVLSLFLFGVVVDVALSVWLYADDLVTMSDKIKGLRNKFLKLKETFESKALKVNLGKTKVSSIKKEGMYKVGSAA